MIELKNILKTYGSSVETQVMALDNINLNIKEKEFIVILGSNGSGKSTLLKMISGEIKPQSGYIFLDKKDITSLAEYRRSRWIARIFQNPLSGTASELSILDNFRLASIRTQRKGLHWGKIESFKKKVQDRISILGMNLENKIQQPMGTLSGGQRQALTLLMATMDKTRILLMDEPTAALDVKSSRLVMQTAENLIREFELTAILVTHQLSDALRFGDRILQLSDGKLKRDINKKERFDLSLPEIYTWMDEN